jgi:hypothetical protein
MFVNIKLRIKKNKHETTFLFIQSASYQLDIKIKDSLQNKAANFVSLQNKTFNVVKSVKIFPFKRRIVTAV